MQLTLHGHDYRYAAEQMMLTLFPQERPGVGENALTLTLSQGNTWLTATAKLTYNGKRYAAARRARTAELTGGLTDHRVRQRILKLAFYDAGVQALGKEPPWGALTGVRPVKIPAKAIRNGATPAQAEKLLRDTYRVSPLRRRLALDCAGESVAAQQALAPGEISLYVGIPFCPSRCVYCSFISAAVDKCLPLVAPFVEALEQEIAATGALLRATGRHVRTVYIGGGTPTTLSAEELDALLSAMARHLPLSRCTEFTVEAGRPDTITPEKLAVLARRGVDRVSVNPQSMSRHVLEAMGRPHAPEDVLRAYAQVREAGDFAVNMDLIAGLPGDSAAGFARSLAQAIALEPENITVHTLALKKGSRLMEERASLPSDGAVEHMLDAAWAALREAGYAPYYLYRQKYMSGSFENVGWAKPGFSSLYNIAMMEELHTILALGGGGVTKLIWPETGKIERVSNPKYPQEYLRDRDKICREKAALAPFLRATKGDQTMAYQLKEINERILTDTPGFLAQCDEGYHKRVEAAADKIIERMEISPIVLLSGPSGSGKTTTALKIEEELERRGVNTHTISLDNYFKTLDPKTAPRTPDGELDFESPDCLDMELLDETFTRLSSGEEVIVPKFEFTRQMRNDAKGRPLKLERNEIAIFEGIHALGPGIAGPHPEATKLYISARSNVLEEGELRFKGTWMRLTRRAVRDYSFRGTDVSSTLAMWANVRRGEKLYISPYKNTADIIVDSSLPYEVSVMKNYALPILKAVPQENQRRAELLDLIAAFDWFEPIDPALVAKNSLLREFIGGGSYHYK